MLRRLSVAVATALIFAVAAQAQATNVKVLNTERVLRESAVGMHIATRISEIEAEMATEREAEQAPVRADIEAFEEETASLTAEEFQANADLVARQQELQQRMVPLLRAEEGRQRELAATQTNALQAVQNALNEVLEALVEEQSIDVLLPRDGVIYVNEATSVTALVIERLNEHMPTLEVTRVRIPLAAEDGG